MQPPAAEADDGYCLLSAPDRSRRANKLSFLNCAGRTPGRQTDGQADRQRDSGNGASVSRLTVKRSPSGQWGAGGRRGGRGMSGVQGRRKGRGEGESESAIEMEEGGDRGAAAAAAEPSMCEK